jgi:site-specific recombinase XerD
MSSTSGLVNPTTVREASDAFIGHLTFKRRSPRTILQYQPVLRDFAIWAGDRPISDLTAFEIESFLASWIKSFEQRRGRTPSDHAVKGQIVALKSLFKYLDRGDLVPSNPMKAIDPPSISQKQNDWLRQSEDEALLATAMNEDLRHTVRGAGATCPPVLRQGGTTEHQHTDMQ